MMDSTQPFCSAASYVATEKGSTGKILSSWYRHFNRKRKNWDCAYQDRNKYVSWRTRMSFLWITTLRISNSSYQWRYSCRVVGITRIILRASFGQVWPLGTNVRYMKIFEFLYLIWIHPTALESRTQVWLCFKQRWSDACTKLKITGVIEGVCIVIHAAPRTEVKGMVSRITLSREPNLNYLSKELHILRDILMHKYGREFSIAVMENRDGCVSSRVSLNN